MATTPTINRNRRSNEALHPDRPWVRVVRVLLGLGTLAAVAWNIYRAATGLSESSVIESCSHFTNQANVVFGLVVLCGAVRSRKSLPSWWDDLRGAAAFYMVMTGLIYALLVAEPGELGRWDLDPANIMLHRVTPVAGLIGWLLITHTRKQGWGRPLAWLAFPLAYLIYTWVRGASANWYPYGFLDPTRPGGWSAVFATTAQVFVAFLAIAVIVHLLGNLRAALAHR